MSILLIIFGLLSGCLGSILVGLLGRTRRIGFGWAFVASLLFSPLIGLIITLLTDPLHPSDSQKWGCTGVVLAILGVLLLVPLFMMLGAMAVLFIAEYS